jgi:hypothetical protein
MLTFAAKDTTTNNPIYFSAKVTIPLIIILLFPNFTQTHFDFMFLISKLDTTGY